MKTITLLSLVALAAISPAVAQNVDATKAPAVAPALPLEPAQSATPAAQSTPATPPTNLGALGSGEAPAAVQKETWNELDESSRYLLIMGTADGFSATGPGAPCFPGRDNTKLDAELKAAGFGSQDPAGLPEALAKLSAPREQCQTAPKRGYTTDLIKGMPDQHLATYLSGVVRGYARVLPCPVANHGYAATTVVTELFGLTSAKQPNELIAPAMATGCSFVPPAN